jgi:hypothetical protein
MEYQDDRFDGTCRLRLGRCVPIAIILAVPIHLYAADVRATCSRKHRSPKQFAALTKVPGRGAEAGGGQAKIAPSRRAMRCPAGGRLSQPVLRRRRRQRAKARSRRISRTLARRKRIFALEIIWLANADFRKRRPHTARFPIRRIDGLAPGHLNGPGELPSRQRAAATSQPSLRRGSSFATRRRSSVRCRCPAAESSRTKPSRELRASASARERPSTTDRT